MSAGAPGGAGVFAVGVAKGDVDAGKFFVLQDVSNDALDAEVGADGKFANAVGVFVGVSVGPEIGFKLLVRTGAGNDAVGGDLNRERGRGEEAVAGAEPVPYYSVDDKGAVDFAGRGEAFTAGEIAPLFRRDDAGGFEPFVVGIHFGGDVGAGGGGGADAGGFANAVEDLLREAIDEIEVGAHTLAHDFGRYVDHVSVAHATAVDDVGHLHAGVELVGLDLHGEDGDLRGLHVGEDGGGHVNERARGEVFKGEGVPLAIELGKLLGNGRGDGFGDAIGDEGDLFGGRDAQAGGDGGTGAGDELGGVGHGKQMVFGFSHSQGAILRSQ